MVKNKKLIVIGGPTASGKTGLSITLAKKLNAPIISADSRQFYKEISIGTAKPTKEEQQGIPHYFINSHSIKTPVSSVQYEKEAIELIEKLFVNTDYIIVVGGSGMFINALLFGTDNLPKDEKVRENLNKQLKEEGICFLLNQLKREDSVFFDEVDKNNSHRIIRALEIMKLTKKTITELRTGTRRSRQFEHSIFVINHKRENLYDRINQRVEAMLKDGLLEEVKSVSALQDLQSLNTVGYKEYFSFLNNEITLDEATELVKRNSRRYAKRQITWFKRYDDAYWIDYTNNETMVHQILEGLENSVKN